MPEVEKTNILAWMDKQIELAQAVEEAEKYNEEISVCNGRYGRNIHVYEGLKKIAQAAEKKIMWQEGTEVQSAKAYIIYKGYKFFSIDPQRKIAGGQPCI